MGGDKTSDSPSSPLKSNSRPDKFHMCILEDDEEFQQKLLESKKAQGKLCCVVFICFIFMIIEVIGGYISNSIAIMTDAAHMFSDVTGFGISIIAIRYGLRKPNQVNSYGYHRAEVLGAMASIIIIWVLVLWLMVEALNRMYTIIYLGGYEMDPQIMVATAVFGLCCNIVNLIALGECFCCEGKKSSASDDYSKEQPPTIIGLEAVAKGMTSSAMSSFIEEDDDANKNLNVRAAMIHMIGDLIQSIGVIIAGLFIVYNPELKILDPILTIMFAIIVFMTTVDITKDCYKILMEVTPEGVEIQRIREKIESIPEVDYVNDLHCWALAGGKDVLTAHIYLKRGDDETSLPSTHEIHKVYQEASRIVKKYHVSHSTL